MLLDAFLQCVVVSIGSAFALTFPFSLARPASPKNTRGYFRSPIPQSDTMASSPLVPPLFKVTLYFTSFGSI